MVDEPYLEPHSSGRGVDKLFGDLDPRSVLLILHNVGGDPKLWLVAIVRYPAGVLGALVDFRHGPEVAQDLVTDRVDVVLRVKVVQLVGQQLSHVEEGQRSHPQRVLVDALCHDFGHLAVLVAIDVDAAVDGQRRQLLILFALQRYENTNAY